MIDAKLERIIRTGVLGRLPFRGKVADLSSTSFGPVDFPLHQTEYQVECRMYSNIKVVSLIEETIFSTEYTSPDNTYPSYLWLEYSDSFIPTLGFIKEYEDRPLIDFLRCFPVESCSYSGGADMLDDLLVGELEQALACYRVPVSCAISRPNAKYNF